MIEQRGRCLKEVKSPCYSLLTKIDFITEGGIPILKSVIETIATGKDQENMQAENGTNKTDSFESKSFSSTKNRESLKQRTRKVAAKSLEKQYTIMLRPSHLSILPEKLASRSLYQKIRMEMDKELSTKSAVYEHVFKKSQSSKYSTSTQDQSTQSKENNLDVLSEDSDELSDPLSENLSDIEDEVEEKPKSEAEVKRIHRQSIMLTRHKFDNPDKVHLDVLKLSKDPSKTLAMWSYYPQTVNTDEHTY